MKTKLVSLVGLLLGFLSFLSAAPAAAQSLDVIVTQLYCSDETGVDWFGSDEVVLEVNSRSVRFNNVDTGDRFNVSIGPETNPSISVVDLDDCPWWFNVAGCERDYRLSARISPTFGWAVGADQWVHGDGYAVRINVCPGGSGCGWRGSP